ncbi:hypothetical protein WQE_17029 [Paraburkholderia hospita]|uniref:Uncharacterized protein n=1 Tax=Paraburkholderia hospita TaxID=169430 RepID=A0AAN1JFE8_9BURK|nr:hypothetical protein C2L64_33145 [Paraburkholderia hospita]EIM99803.1 hypothetical protein WQE_17029 [Paraburkholderia hospita]OUL85766.1 hypothetical protein CA602_17285 [Paraburkholderia hospita]OUL88552.1 hypothetical protein CA601_18665 [Paraburkholderia hospita]
MVADQAQTPSNWPIQKLANDFLKILTLAGVANPRRRFGPPASPGHNADKRARTLVRRAFPLTRSML